MSKAWTDEEKELLKKIYLWTKWGAILEFLPHRSKSSIKQAASLMRISRRRYEIGRDGHGMKNTSMPSRGA